jgi:glycosyltransferase involved in cell wall biosynthesis
MKIVQILAGNEEGGLEKHVEELSNALSQKHEVHLIAHEKYRSRMDKRVHFHALDLSRGRRNPLMLWKLYRLVRDIDPQIVHAHANKAVEMLAKVKPFFFKKIKCIGSLHSQKRNPKAFYRCDHVIGVSHRVLSSFRKISYSVVYNGIKIGGNTVSADGCRQKLGIAPHAFVVCAVGRLEAVKNFALLFETIASLEVVLLLVGEGSMKKQLQIKAKKMNIEKKVVFVGQRNDVDALLLCADVCVISSDREGFSYVMAEALLLERPVISTDVGDMRKILPPEAVVPVGDKIRLAEAIANVKKNYPDIKQEYQKSFDFAKENFTIDGMVHGIESVYKKVLER